MKECHKNQLDSSHDWFCFYCDAMVGEKSQQYLKCQNCNRIFHRKCAEEYHKVKDYLCGFCERVQQKDCYVDYKMVDKKRVNQMVAHYMDFVKNKANNKYQKCDKQFEENFIFKKMNLSLMRQKAERLEYNCLEEFDDDFYFFMHNLSLTQTQVVDIAQSFLDLRSELLKELTEIKKCVDCYQRFNDKQLKETNKEWLSLPCAQTHEPVFVKMKGWPYWPAKVIEINENNKIEICFFEPQKSKDKRKGSPPIALKKEVSRRDVKLLTDDEAINSVKASKDQRLIKSMALLVRYLELMPNNGSYITSIEKLKQIKYDSSFDSIDESIESVINRSSSKCSKKTPLCKRVSTKTPTPVRPTSSEGQQHSAITRISSNASTRSSSPSVPPVLEFMSDSNDSITIVSEVMTNFPKMDISEGPPPLERIEDLTQSSQLTPNQSKRRSERIAKITPQKKETDNKTPSKESSTKISHQIKVSDKSEPMDVEEENKPTKIPIKLVVDIPVSMSEEIVLQIDVQKNKENKRNIDLNSESKSKKTSVLRPLETNESVEMSGI